jgi:hypothetical protein
MFNSHIYQQYDKHVPYSIIQSTYSLQNGHGSEENYINAADKLRVGSAFTGIDRRTGLPNNHLQNSADIPDFHPRFHLNNDAGKLSRLMVATRKYKENYDMQANRRKVILGFIRRRQWLTTTP